MSTIQNRVLNRLRASVGNLRHRYVDDFIFIHINKTGGSSIEHALGIPFGHRTALEVIGDVGEALWREKLTFCFVSCWSAIRILLCLLVSTKLWCRPS